ncbi:SusE domain-containing protein [Aquiflexum lacus]|uniref:SusE domain-containing protein n=1 Tax=Aquiflexum lacus TaxID=2483805 RepID=UPI0018951C52|nr:SusF/SusE family outer membrane protein [Aquiflexum lacus]
MRKFSKILWVAFLLPLIWSCGEIAPPPIISQTTSSVLSTSPIVLTEDEAEESIAFEVSPADFGISTEVTYVLQMDRPGNDFAAPIDLGSNTSTTILVEVAELNRRAISKGIVAGETGNMEFRVKAVTPRNISDLFGAPASIAITTYADAVILRNLFLVGEATAPGWSNDNNNPALFRDPVNTDLYVYTGFFNPGGFKVLGRLGEWQPQYGTNDGSTIAVNDGGGSDPEVFTIPSAGIYTFTMDLDANTFSIEPFTDGAGTDFATVGIIGDATPGGWDGSTAMTKSTFDGNIWTITANLTPGELKFRANDAWTVNWGADTAISGIGTQDGPNIPVEEAGTYTIWFNSLDGSYILIQ